MSEEKPVYFAEYRWTFEGDTIKFHNDLNYICLPSDIRSIESGADELGPFLKINCADGEYRLKGGKVEDFWIGKKFELVRREG